VKAEEEREMELDTAVAYRWRGRYVTVYGTGRWAFHACVVCGQGIGDRTSRLRGAGYGCRKKTDPDEMRSRLEIAKAQERERFLREVGSEPPAGL
jgi:hypothetical protein